MISANCMKISASNGFGFVFAILLNDWRLLHKSSVNEIPNSSKLPSAMELIQAKKWSKYIKRRVCKPIATKYADGLFQSNGSLYFSFD